MTILYINESHCTSLEQLRSYFEDSPSYDSPLFFDILDYARSGDISTWLRENGEAVLADQVDGIDGDLGDSKYFSRLSALMTGNNTSSDSIEKPDFSKCFHVEDVNQEKTSEGMNVHVRLKVLSSVNETYEISVSTSWGQRGDTINPYHEEKDGTLTKTFSFRKRPNEDFKVKELLADGMAQADVPVSGLGGDVLEFEVGTCRFKMIRVEGGTFEMRDTTEQGSDAESDAYPVHSVTLSGYYIGKFEVTQELWEAVMGSNPSNFRGAQNPVESVSWNDCQNFIKKLNSLTGRTFRLPTEAEWEYAARGGNKSRHYKYSGSDNIDDVAWYWKNSGDRYLLEPDSDWDSDKIINNHCRTHAIGTKTANELGIYDMSGNVYEWCSDWYGDYSAGAQTNPQGPSSGSRRVLRGGSWYDGAGHCRVSNRDYCDPGLSTNDFGLRLVLVP